MPSQPDVKCESWTTQNGQPVEQSDCLLSFKQLTSSDSPTGLFDDKFVLSFYRDTRPNMVISTFSIGPHGVLFAPCLRISIGYL
jgi:hypothetical protein